MSNIQSPDLLLHYKDYSLIVWPNIGKPNFISIQENILQSGESFAFDLLILTYSTKNISDVKNDLTGNLFLIPLLGINPKTNQANRGKQLPLLIYEVSAVKLNNITKPDQFERFFIPNAKFEHTQKSWGFEYLRENLAKDDVFLGRSQCYKIMVIGSLSTEIKSYLLQQRYILFDLLQHFPTLPQNPRILYHSICLTKNISWEQFNYIQISDLHISTRNDEILSIILKKTKQNKSEQIVPPPNPIKRFLNRFKTKKKEPINEEIEVDPEEDFSIPLEQRFRNPNNMLRRFIRFANLIAENKKLDFIVMTGDLIDFCIKSDAECLPKLKFDYEYTNWSRFKQILLNDQINGPNGEELCGIEKNQELLVPIFTLLGNHDYRAGHYNIQSLGVYKFYGLNLSEVRKYTESHYPIYSLYSPNNSLKPYFQHINPFQDFCLKFGNHTFIFLDSGSDSIAEIKYLLMADPSLTGFSDDQMKYLKLIGKELVNINQGRVFLFSHAPILNPMLKRQFMIKLFQKFGTIPKFDIVDFKESRLKILDKRDTRSDIDLEYHSGTIASNWINVMDFMDKYKGLALQGHTHKWLEFKTKLSNIPSISHTGYGKAIKNPYAIYWDDYTKINANNPSFFDSELPFYMQTPALGIQNRKWRLPPGGYRVVEIKENKIERIAVNFVGTNYFMYKWHL